MITSIRLKNFKAIKSLDIPTRKINLIFGANNSGKSTILQGILSLKQTLDNSSSSIPFVTSGNHVDLGSFQDLKHCASNKHESVSIGVSFKESDARPGDSGESDISNLVPCGFDLNLNYDADSERIYVSKIKLHDQKVRTYEWENTSPKIIPIDGADLKKRIGLSFFFPNITIMAKEQPSGNIDPAILEETFAVHIHRDFYSSFFEHVFHVNPVRDDLSWVVLLGETTGQEMTKGGDSLVRFLSKDLTKDNSRLKKVNNWLSCNDYYIQELSVRKDAIGRVASLYCLPKGYSDSLNVASMGSGVAQFLPIVAASLNLPNKCALVVEQPELHLHPCAQLSLADLFCTVATEADRQLFIETHSEHILLRFRKLILEGKIATNDIQVIFVNIENGSSCVRIAHIDKHGFLSEEMPEDFFGDAFKESAAIAKLRMNRISQD